MANQTGQERQGTYKRYLFSAEKIGVPRNTKKRWLEKNRQTFNHHELITNVTHGDNSSVLEDGSTSQGQTDSASQDTQIAVNDYMASSIPNELVNTNSSDISATSLKHNPHDFTIGNDSRNFEDDGTSHHGHSYSSQDAQDFTLGNDSSTFEDDGTSHGHSDSSQDAQEVTQGDDSSTFEDDSTSQGHSHFSQDAQGVTHGDDSGTSGDDNSSQGHLDSSQDAQHQLFNSDDQTTISPESLVTKGQLLLLVMAFVIKHQMTGTCLEDLLSLLNLVVPGSILITKYLFNKQFNAITNIVQKHFYCSNCSFYLGVQPMLDECPGCNAYFNFRESEKTGSFFLYIPIANQLKSLLEKQGMSDFFYEDQSHVENYQDIHQGIKYKEIFQQRSTFDLSLLLNCDGVPLFKSSKTSIWPIQIMLNELPREKRSKHIILCGIWVGNSKPKVEVFFRPMVDELKKLGSEGFQWQDNKGNHLSRVFSAVCSCDAVARCMLQNFHQYNGSFGCGTCLHEGETVEKGMGFTRVYPVRGVVEYRTVENTVERARDAVRLNTVVQGVKGPSILSLLPKFDLIDGFVPEYMHSVILGVVRQFTKLWLDSENHEKPFYIGKFTSSISNLLQAIKPCSEGDRLPRCISERKFWKATEWRNFLFYSPILLSGILPNNYLAHWWLLVFAINNLTSSSVSSLMINESRAALLKFVIKIESLYGLEHISYNVHQLTHLSQYVTNWGPLWATSAFAFENNNQVLKNSYHGTKGVASQIVKNLLIWSKLDSLSELCISSAAESVLSFYNQLSLRGCKFIRNAYYVCESCTGLGNPTVRFLHDWEKAVLCEVTSIDNLNSKVYCFSRFVLMKKLIHSHDYSTNVRQNDSVLALSNGKFVSVHALVIVKESLQDQFEVGTPFIIGQDLKPTNFSVRDSDVNTNLAQSYRKVMFSDAVVCKPEEFKCKCLMILHQRGNFILEWPGNDLSD